MTFVTKPCLQSECNNKDILILIIYKVMKYRKILIKYNAYFKKTVLHSHRNIKKKSCISQL